MVAFIGQAYAVWTDHFLGNVLVSRAVNAKVFTEINEALNWLAG
jgi:uncharacterized protein YgfB (UPF0149 family)